MKPTIAKTPAWQVPLLEEDDVEYIIRQTAGPTAMTVPPEDRSTFQIARFEFGSNEPTSVYDVDYFPTTMDWTCECQGFWRKGQEDKHIQMVKAWIEAGRPVNIDLGALDRYLAKLKLSALGVDVESPDWEDFASEAKDLTIYIRRKDIDHVVEQLSRLNDIALQFVDKGLLPNLEEEKVAAGAVGQKTIVDALIDAVVPSSVSGLVGRWMIVKAIMWLVNNKFMPSGSGDQLLRRTHWDNLKRYYSRQATSEGPRLEIPPVDASRIWKSVQKFLDEHDVTWEQLRDLMLEANMTDKDLIQILFDRIVTDEAVEEVVNSQLTDFLHLHPEVDIEPITPARAARARKLVAAVAPLQRRVAG